MRTSVIKTWTRMLLQPLASGPRPPAKVEALAGGGFHVLLFSPEGRCLHLCLTKATQATEAYYRSSITTLRYLGAAEIGEIEGSWLESIVHSVGRIEGRPGWSRFLDWATRQPARAMATASLPGTRQTSGQEFLVRLTGRCNARCRFCSARGLMPDLVRSPKELEHRLQVGRVQGFTQLTFTGGEPTLVKGLAGTIRSARGLGYDSIRLQTNGIVLAEEPVFRRYHEAGLGSVFFSLHSADPKIHDAMLGVKGAFAKVHRAALLCRQAGMMVGFNCVLTPDNLAGVEHLVQWIQEQIGGDKSYLYISFCSPQGRAQEHLELMPRIEEAAVSMIAAIERGRNLGLAVRIPGLCGVPMCALPEHLESLDEFHDHSPPLLATRSFLPGCPRCSVRERCSGFWTAYLDRFGSAGLNPEAIARDRR